MPAPTVPPNPAPVTDVPPDQLGEVVDDYYDAGATSVGTWKQANGNFTVQALFDSSSPIPAPPPPAPQPAPPPPAPAPSPGPAPSPTPPSGPIVDQITQIAGQSAVAQHAWWKGQGVAPIGYIKGMALVFARVYCKLKKGDPGAQEMAKPKGSTLKDVLNFYSPQLAAAGLDTNIGGPDTLRHLFAVLIGLALPESSGRYWLGADPGADNHDGETAEAGLFQTSWNARAASIVLMVNIYKTYSSNPDGFLSVFKEGVRPPGPHDDLTNYGTGDGQAYQQLSKNCPAFAAEFSAVGLRNIGGPHPGGHWGTISDGLVQILAECDTMLQAVRNAVDAAGIQSV